MIFLQNYGFSKFMRQNMPKNDQKVLKLFFQKRLKIFLWVKRKCSRYLKGVFFPVLCVRKKIMVIRFVYQNIFKNYNSPPKTPGDAKGPEGVLLLGLQREEEVLAPRWGRGACLLFFARFRLYRHRFFASKYSACSAAVFFQIYKINITWIWIFQY